jgi:hypothetical protein
MEKTFYKLLPLYFVSYIWCFVIILPAHCQSLPEKIKNSYSVNLNGTAILKFADDCRDNLRLLNKNRVKTKAPSSTQGIILLDGLLGEAEGLMVKIDQLLKNNINKEMVFSLKDASDEQQKKLSQLLKHLTALQVLLSKANNFNDNIDRLPKEQNLEDSLQLCTDFISSDDIVKCVNAKRSNTKILYPRLQEPEELSKHQFNGYNLEISFCNNKCIKKQSSDEIVN